MHDKLTNVDIQKMREEIEYRAKELRPKLLEEVKRTREYGDLSENAEYKEAKREKNRNESRIRYLKNMIETAVIVEVDTSSEVIGLFDKVELFYEMNSMTKKIQIVTTLRQDVMKGYISGESPLGKALLGKKKGDRVLVEISPDRSFYVQIKDVEKGTDDDSLPISSF